MLNSMKTVIIKKDECVRNLNHQVASATYNARPFPMQFCLIYYRGYSPSKVSPEAAIYAQYKNTGLSVVLQ